MNGMLLSGKTAIITGVSRGIGRETLNLFVKNGANVFACYRKKDTKLEEEFKELEKKYDVEIIPIVFDLSNIEEVKKSAREIQRFKKKIDILVNVAGIMKDSLFQMICQEEMYNTFQVNFFSPILFTQYISRLMLRNNYGSIINVSSMSAIEGLPGQLSYASSKAALITATKTIAAELGAKGIRVNAVAPGVIDTDLISNVPEDIINHQMMRSDLKRLGKTEEVASLILYLASDLSSYITGQVIRIDGGIG